MNNLMIQINKLIKIYRRGYIEVTALRGIDLEVKKGDFLAIKGASGSGKSTLLNVIGGISLPTAGVVTVDGQKLTTLSEAQLAKFRSEKIGFVWQISNLLPELSIIDNIRLTMLAARKFKNFEMNKRAKLLLKDVGILERAHHRIYQISGGELQRASIAVALANDPKIILADEPTGELDSETSLKIMNLFKKLNEEYSKTILIVTHDPLVASNCKSNLTIKDGIILKKPLKSGLEYLKVDKEGRFQIPEELVSDFANKKVKISQSRDGELKISLDS